MEEFGIPHCIGIIDGFHVTLETAPARDDAGAFHSRKERYGYNVLGVIDDTKRFRYLPLWLSSIIERHASSTCR